MLPTETANLPAEQRQRLHADFLADEQAYLQMRASLLPRYRGQWVAVRCGQLVAAGTDLLQVMETATAGGGHPYIALVGQEGNVVFRLRRAVGFAHGQTIGDKPSRRLGRLRGLFLGRGSLRATPKG